MAMHCRFLAHHHASYFYILFSKDSSSMGKGFGTLVTDEDKAEARPVTLLADGDVDMELQLGLVEDMVHDIGVCSKRFGKMV
jgi:hypothetical protein